MKICLVRIDKMGDMVLTLPIFWSYITRAANTPIQIVSRQLRHRNISMTWDVYGHLYPQDLNQVADTMEAIFG